MSSAKEARENRGFAREIKFFVPPEKAELIREWSRSRLAPDPHADGPTGDLYRITSLYFDTEDFDVYNRTGSYGRAKYRIRRYGEAEAVFLERKMKARNMVSKRRSLVEMEELARLSAPAPNGDWAGRWFHRRLLARELRPVCQISYIRTARVDWNAYGPVRLTFDQDLCAIPAGEFEFNHDRSGAGLAGGLVIIEMKYRRDMPTVFKHIVEEFALNPQRISKYRLAAEALGYVENPADENVRGYAENVECLSS